MDNYFTELQTYETMLEEANYFSITVNYLDGSQQSSTIMPIEHLTKILCAIEQLETDAMFCIWSAREGTICAIRAQVVKDVKITLHKE